MKLPPYKSDRKKLWDQKKNCMTPRKCNQCASMGCKYIKKRMRCLAIACIRKQSTPEKASMRHAYCHDLLFL